MEEFNELSPASNPSLHYTMPDLSQIPSFQVHIAQSGHFDHLGRIKSAYFLFVLSCTYVRIELIFVYLKRFEECLNVTYALEQRDYHPLPPASQTPLFSARIFQILSESFRPK